MLTPHPVCSIVIYSTVTVHVCCIHSLARLTLKLILWECHKYYSLQLDIVADHEHSKM